MEFYRDLSFRWKLSLPLGVLVALILAMSAIGYSTNKQLGRNSETIAVVNLPEIQLLIQADRDLYQALVAERAMSQVSADQYAALEQEREENAQQAHDRVLQSLSTSDTATAAERQEYLTRFDAWKSVSDRVAASIANGATEEAVAVSFGEGEKAFKYLRGYIDQLEDLRLAHVDQFTAQSHTFEASSSAKQFSLALASVLVSVLALLALPLVVTRPLQRITDRLQNIAEGDGDLTIRLDASSRDELGALAGHVNQFMEKLQRVIAEVKQNTREVSVSAEALLQVSATSQHAADGQCQAITMVVTAVNELSAAIQEVARNTSDSARNSQAARATTDEGQNRIQLAVSQVQSLSERVAQTVDTMTTLAEEAKQVTSVVDVIRGVAEQTNLLALNAAIEAARAGEQGRGFAVVADEVRTLASRTQQSTQDIQSMLEQLQVDVQQAVASMNASANMTIDAVMTANQAGEALIGIGAAVRQISDMTLQVASAVEEQSSVTSEIDKNLVQINSLAMSTLEDASRTASESQRLNSLSGTLQNLLAQFRV